MSPERLWGFKDSRYFQVALSLLLALAHGSASCLAPPCLLLAASAPQQWILIPLEPESKINCHFLLVLVFYHSNSKVMDTSGVVRDARRDHATVLPMSVLLKTHRAKLPSKYLYRHPQKLLSAWPLKLLLMQSH